MLILLIKTIMKQRTINLFGCFLLMVSIFFACANSTGQNENNQNEKIEYISTPQKTKDSLSFLQVIQECINKEFDYFDNFKYFKIPLRKVTFWIDDIYYSPDSLKMIAAVINREPNNEDMKSQNKDSSYYYDGFAFIGYRKTID